jgi:thiamine-phosphate pyrophosphorylase
MLVSPLYVICDAEVCEREGWTLVDFASACLDGGARLLQVRAKDASSGWLLERVEAILARAAAAGATVIVNDRADIARVAGAQGVHIGQVDLSPAAVRHILGDQSLVGLSTHTAAQVQAALAEPISYLAIGPTFRTATKDSGYEALGVGGVREAAQLAAQRGLPVVAIGGITLERAAAVIENGATSVAIISDLLATGDPSGRVAAYLQRLSRL